MHLYVLVREDVPGEALRVPIEKPTLARILGQKTKIAGDLLDALHHPQASNDVEPGHMAPEVYGELTASSPSSDISSAGLVLYERFTGEQPLAAPTEPFDQSAVFPVKPSALRFDLPKVGATRPSLPEPSAPRFDYSDLPPQTQLTPKYVIEKRLGKPGSFAVAYKVIDTLGDVSRVMKLVLRDRHSTLERLKKEYRTLLRIPDHPNVVKVIDADFLPGNGPPFLVFEYVEGIDVGEMIDGNLFGPEDVLELARQVASALVHLHGSGVFHCDIKPRNLLWTDRGTKIIDFNMSVLSAGENGNGGGSRRYLPPDLDLQAVPSRSDLADRDLYALGLTLYEALTRSYPWETAVPPPGKPVGDPRELSHLGDIAPEFADLVLRAIAPTRAARFSSALELQSALANVPSARPYRLLCFSL
jgi:serine/threonine protein kinase